MAIIKENEYLNLFCEISVWTSKMAQQVEALDYRRWQKRTDLHPQSCVRMMHTHKVHF